MSQPSHQGNACRKRSANSHVPCSVVMPEALQSAIIRIAQAEDRSFSATVRRAVEVYLAANPSKEVQE